MVRTSETQEAPNHPPRQSTGVRAAFRLLAFAAAIALASAGYRDHFHVGTLPWWRWVVEVVAAAALLVLALPHAGAASESRGRRLLRWLCGAAALFAWAAVVVLVPERGREAEAALAVVAGIVLVAAARWVPFAPATLERVFGDRRASGGRRWLGAAIIVVALGCSLGAVWSNDEDHLLGFSLWLLGIVSFALGVRVAGGSARPATASPWRHESGPALRPSFERAMFVVILAVGAGFRLFAIGEVPTWIDADEGRLATWGLGIWRDGFPDAFAFGWNSFPHLTYMLHVSGVQLLGYANVHLRLVSAVIGIASLIPLYFWARRWWGGVVALLAMALLAVNQEHIYWSRVGFNNIDAVLVAALVLASLARALGTARAIDWVWVGVALGAGFHTYHAAKLFPVLVALACLVLAIGARWSFATHVRGIAAAAVAFVLTLGPQFVSLQRQWVTFRVDTTNRNNLHVAFDAFAAGDVTGLRNHVYRQVVDCLYAFISVPYQMPLLEAATAAPFLAGALWLYWRWRDPRHVVVLVWIAGILVAGGMMTDFPPSKQRMVGFLPAVCLVPAILAGRARGLLNGLFGRRGDALAFLLAVIWLSFAAYNNWWTHFVYQADRMRGDVMTNVCARIKSADRPLTIYSIGATSSTNPHMLERDCTLGPDEARFVVNPAADHAVAPLPPDHRGDAIFSLTSDQRALVPWIRFFYPQGKFEIVRGPGGHEDLYLVSLARAEVERTRGLSSLYRDSGGSWRLGELPTAYPPPNYVPRLQVPANAASGTEALWRGRIWIEASGLHRFRAVDGQVRVGLAGIAGTAIELIQGWHPIEVAITAGLAAEGTVLEWLPPQAADWAPVPRENLFVRFAAPALVGRYFDRSIVEDGAVPIDADPAHQRIEGALAFDWRFHDDDEMPEWFAPRPSTMEWIGTVDLGASRDMVIRVEATTPTQVYVGGRRVVALSGTSDDVVAEVGLPDLSGVVPFLVRTRRPPDDDPSHWMLRISWATEGGRWSVLGPYALAPAADAASIVTLGREDPGGREGDPREN